MQRSRKMDSLQGFLSAFKQFEKKLEKLQDDVNYHGNTLCELKSMVMSLAAETIPEDKREVLKRGTRKNVGLQYEPHKQQRRVDAIGALPKKIRAKSLPGHKCGLGKPKEVLYHHTPKKNSASVVMKHQRPRKAEAPRKANVMRTPKTTDKKRKHRK